MTILRASMPTKWIIRETTERDYGIDLYVELVGDDQRLSGDLVAFQLKAMGSVEWKRDHFTVARIKRETLNYWLSLPIPVFLVVACLRRKEVFWANIRQLNREGRFEGDSRFVSVRLSHELDFSEPGIAALRLSYFREKRWPDIENAMEMSLMLFNSFGPLVLMCSRGGDKTPCSTTVQYLINQHYEYYSLMCRYLIGSKAKPLPEWYVENLAYIKSTGLEPSLTLYHHTLKTMLHDFAGKYRDCILAAYKRVTDLESVYFSKRLPFLYMHLKARPHTFILEDWFARFYYDEYEKETQHPERLYFSDFEEFDNALDGIEPT